MIKFVGDIGGYGELELPHHNQNLHEKAYSLQSARAALFFFLKKKSIKKVFLPDYICDNLYPLFDKLQITLSIYPVDDSLGVPTDIFPREGELLLIVNYFGICRSNIDKFLKDTKIPFSKIIIDNSQALFESAKKCAASIYSPRKFLGIPDGGFLYTDEVLAIPNKEFQASNYIAHLIQRSAGDVELGYANFLEAERALSRFEPKRMSKISQRLIHSYDLEDVKQKRILHFKILQSAFRDINLNRIERSEDEVPLCFPLKVDRCVEEVCQKLVKSNIYLPRYWPNLKAGVHAEKWFRGTLFLPVDHRLNEKKLEFLIFKTRELLLG